MMSSLAGKSVWVLFILGLVMVLLPSLGIYGWSYTMKQVKHAIDVASMDSQNYQMELLSYLKFTTESVFPTSSSILKLSKILSVSVNGNMTAFSTIENKVADKLYPVFSTVQHLSQISYIGENGLLFSYFKEGNQIRALFANESFSSHGPTLNTSGVYLPYSQPVNDFGLRWGEATKSTPLNFGKSTWFYDALNNENGSASFGMGWGKDQEPLFLFMVPVKPFVQQGQRGVLSVGVPVKVVTSFMRIVDLLGGYWYLGTKDGHSVAQAGRRDTKIGITNGTIWVEAAKSDYSSPVGSPVNLSCNLNNHLDFDKDMPTVTEVNLQGLQSLFYCSPLEIGGLQLVSVLAFPRDGLANLVHRQNKVTLLLLLLLIAYVFLVAISFVVFISGAWRRILLLRAALIKQNEATLQAERKSMNKSNAFASASHDVRTSLAAILGLIDLSRGQVPSESELEANLIQMNNCASNLLGILNTVLDTSKIEAGKMQLEEVEFDLSRVLEEIADIFFVVGNKKGLEVILDPCDSSIMKLPIVKGDCGRLKQILSNLLSNAVKFTSEGHIVLRAWAKKPHPENAYLDSKHGDRFSSFYGCLPLLAHKNEDAYNDVFLLNKVQARPNCVEIIFEVDDTGKGIPKEKHYSVFENFVQVKESTVGVHEGTGLGLGIVQSLVRLMGGEIGIVEKDLGEKGACFRFNIFLTTNDKTGSTVREENIRPLGDNVPYGLKHQNVAGASTFHPETPSSVKSMTSSKGHKQDSIHAVILYQGEEGRRISQKWMEDQGIKVWSIARLSHLKPTLEKLKHRLSLTQNLSVAGRSDSASASSHSNNSLPLAFNNEEIEVSPSARGDRDESSPSLVRREIQRITSFTSSLSYLLIVIDMSCGPFMDASKILASFSKNAIESHYKVIWLANSSTSDFILNSLKSKQVPCDLILRKPFHGSRLHKVLRLLQEFGATHETRASVTLEVGSDRLTEPDDLHSDSAQRQPMHTKRESENNGVKVEPLKGINVLLVEDNDVLSKLSMAMLASYGANVETSRNGEEAVNLVSKALRETRGADGVSKSFPYNIILMDCQMPVMDGFRATEMIRKEEKWYGRRIPIIALTAHATSEEVKRCFDSGMDAHLLKPIRRDKLSEEILALSIKT